MKELTQLMYNLNNLLYLEPVTQDIEIGDMGSREFTSTKDIVEGCDYSDGWIEVYATYKTHVAILMVDLMTREVIDYRLTETDYEAIKNARKDYETYERGNTMK